MGRCKQFAVCKLPITFEETTDLIEGTVVDQVHKEAPQRALIVPFAQARIDKLASTRCARGAGLRQ